MKRFISLLLATSMAFAVPVFADTEGQSYAQVYAEKLRSCLALLILTMSTTLTNMTICIPIL